ncbi:AAA family ATPase [Nocardia sp. CNY236]|uniref:AAA family ATPase n=1 Tax=Nocardia sp. CNY236 TaxID=1169152 RepID=UPI001E64C2E9|nr:AAA family ATPase [Nocardia sp. CNY236]
MSATSAFERFVDALGGAGCKVTVKGDRGRASAPGHSHDDDGISFRRTEDGVIFHPFNADPDGVLDSLGLSKVDLFDRPRTRYDYPDGRQVIRFYTRGGNKKTFAQGGKKEGKALFGSDRLSADTDTVIYVVEGEKDVVAARAAGIYAVTQNQGADHPPGRADWSPLADRTVIVVADRDDKGRARADKVAKHLVGLAKSVTVAEVKAGKDLADHIAAGHSAEDLVVLGEVRPARKLKVTRGSEVAAKRVRWVMPDWMPAGSLTLLAGREGLGKSTIAAQVAAEVTCGGLAGGEWFGQPRTVIYLHTEDSREHTVAPRLRAAGADMSRVLFLDVQTEHSDAGVLSLPSDIAMLDGVITAERVSLIVLDAATSAMSAELSGKDDRQVRQFLEPLAQLAARRDCVVLGVCHFGKRDGNDTGKLILGSIAWSQVARSVLAVARDDEGGNLVVTNTKGNLAPRTRSMEAVIESTTVATEDGPAEVGAIRWLGETDRDARELLAGAAGAHDEDEKAERSTAERWLRDYLEAAGSAKSADAKRDGVKAGFSDRTLQRARRKLGVEISDSGYPRTTYWRLPTSAATDTADALTRGTIGTTGTTEPDQGKQGGTTEENPQSCQPPTHDTTAAQPADKCPVCAYALGAIAARDGIHADCRDRAATTDHQLRLVGGGAA